MKFETEQDYKEYQQHVEEQAAKHSLPSPLTIKLMEQQNIAVEIIKTKVENITENLKKNSDEHEKMFKKIDDFIERSDNQYARKDDFYFWRNFLVVGLFLSIALSALAALFKTFFTK